MDSAFAKAYIRIHKAAPNTDVPPTTHTFRPHPLVFGCTAHTIKYSKIYTFEFRKILAPSTTGGHYVASVASDA
ncbi:unnamed protein product [Ceratitis capitata]|uniref:(Mediterranean fruit fly) hypothetical protein n=1 Tax=Ceratitis capitata TaxID=7213 RepID=A0A811V488_CERCA|nr:unnamed protein product [Ceratitis capitata]